MRRARAQVRNWVKVVLVGGAVIAGVSGAVFILMFPHTNPEIIHVKTRVIGSRFVYAPLAYDETRWEVVLAGVRSGAPVWLRVAADLRPALDTHPGEEMLGAVSGVLDTNPLGAVRILLPGYGPDIVCGRDEEGLTIDRSRAERRERLLHDLGVAELGPCLEAVRRAQRSGAAG
jgi:hypothetical protein